MAIHGYPWALRSRAAKARALATSLESLEPKKTAYKAYKAYKSWGPRFRELSYGSHNFNLPMDLWFVGDTTPIYL